MRRLLTMALIMTTSIAGAAEHEIRGARAILQPGATIAIGEMHGTVEAPAAIGDLAAIAAARGDDVEVGLEISTGEQPAFDSYVASRGTADDRARLLAGAHRHAEFPDGRSSEAMLALIERIRVLRRSGRAVHVFACVGIDPSIARDRSMAETAARIRQSKPRAVMILLAGNNHTRVDAPGAMGTLLRALGIPLLSLNLAHGPGRTWGCSGTCGPIDVDGRDRGSERYIELSAGASGSAFDGIIYVGRLHASPPAIQPGVGRQ